jgi:hypothetical protein
VTLVKQKSPSPGKRVTTRGQTGFSGGTCQLTLDAETMANGKFVSYLRVSTDKQDHDTLRKKYQSTAYSAWTSRARPDCQEPIWLEKG